MMKKNLKLAFVPDDDESDSMSVKVIDAKLSSTSLSQ